MSQAEVKLINVYKSPKCPANDLNTTHENFTVSVLLKENIFSMGMFIVGVLIIFFGIYQSYDIAIMAAGAAVITAGIWLARHDIEGYLTSDIIQRCKV